MMIELGAPNCLPLGLVRIESDSGLKTCLMGITLQHPPMHIMAYTNQQLIVTGARADYAHIQARTFIAHHKLTSAAKVEIELAIPSLVGLSSDSLMALSIARTLAWANELPTDDTLALAQALNLGPTNALAIRSFEQGGLLLVDTQTGSAEISPVVRRHELAHKDEIAWAFVLILPRIPAGTPDTLEAERLALVIQAAAHLSDENAQLANEKLWPALESDDITGFGQHLMTLQALNAQAFDAVGLPALTPDEQALLAVMRANGAIAWGRSPVGIGMYGLVHGAKATHHLRNKLREHVGYQGGIVQAAITDNTGARHTVKSKA